MTLKHKIFFLNFIALIFILGGSLHAQDDLRQEVQKNLSQLLPESPVLPDVKFNGKTHPEKIVFTQIKLSGDQADIDSFAKASPLVLKAQDIDKTAMALAEYNRIGNSFNMHDENAPIVAHTMLAADEYSSLQDMVIFDELDEASFFQFKMYDYVVGIVPENIKQFSKLALSKPSAERFFKMTGGENLVLAELILLPTYADNQTPIVINGETIWLMAARVGEFRLWSDSKDPELLWFYRAPWFQPKDKSDLGQLYSKP